MRRPTSFRFAATSLAVVLALGMVLVWLTWRLFEQDRALARQRRAEAQEVGADSAVVHFQKQLARVEQDLDAFAEGRKPSDRLTTQRDSLFLRMDPVYPTAGPAPQRRVVELEAADRLEFAQADYAGALRVVSGFRAARDPEVAAGALVREGRLLRRLGRWDAAVASYQRLAGLGEVSAGGIPAVLAARAGELEAHHGSGNQAASEAAARMLIEQLVAGRHPLSPETFELLGEMALCLQPGLVPYVALAEAAQGLRDRSTEPGSGSSRWVETRSGPVLVVERRTSTGRAAYLAGEAALRTEWLGLVRPALSSLGLEIALATPDGRAVAGTPPPSGHTVRLAQSTHLPWTVMVFPNQSKPSVPDFRGALLFGGLAVLLLGVGGAMWVANRAVARELELARLKSEFVATVSHEFRTPLTAIRQLSELLVTGRVALQEDRQEYYKLLAAQGERLHRLVEGLLNFGRLEAGRLRLRKERFDAAEFARREAAQFEQQPAAGGFRIECSLPPEPALVEADPDALRLSLANLLENAVKYSPGMASVAVNVSAGGDRVRIAVGDRGPGIEPGEQKRIFEKFVRGQAAQAGNVPGTGIGLAMARELMLAHGGDIELHSEVGKGSTFTLVLPRVN